MGFYHSSIDEREQIQALLNQIRRLEERIEGLERKQACGWLHRIFSRINAIR